MKKLMTWVLALVLVLGMATFASAEETKVYQLGDKMEDFTVTLVDGQEVSLYGLLAEKKAVLINFWATWCPPCKMEFPFMQEAYTDMSDEIGILALSTEPEDTAEAILEIKDELGLTTLPMGLDVGISEHFSFVGIPTSVVVDRNGIVCFQESGAITNKEKFLRLFSVYTADDYTEPVLLSKVPAPVPTVETPTVEAMSAALGIQGEQIKLDLGDDSTRWPFSVSDDGTYVQASNLGIEETRALFDVYVTAEDGQALAYDYLADVAPIVNLMTVSVNDEVVQVYGGEHEWATDFVAFDKAGEYKVTFSYACDTLSPLDIGAKVGKLRMISADDVATLEAAKPVKPAKTLPGETAVIEEIEGSTKEVAIKNWVEEDMGTLSVLQGNGLKLRIKLGEDVDDDQAFVRMNNEIELVKNLERDSEGYLYDYSVIGEEPAELMGNRFAVFSWTFGEGTNLLAMHQWFNSELGLVSLIDKGKEYMKDDGLDISKVEWSYVDGSPKVGVEQAAAQPESAEGQYVVVVTDEAGNPVPGVMVQVCDATTCQVMPTDADGKVVHAGAPYAYEYHVLAVPAEYAKDAQTYTLPEEGGILEITLKKQ
ncbi:MAG: TlpA disulfide reductase family protein [Clostridia bacterium]